MKQSIVELFVKLGMDSYSLDSDDMPEAVESYKGRGYSPARPAIAANSMQILLGLLSEHHDTLEPNVTKEAITELANCGQDSFGRGRIFY